ncbi:hypothetical protein ABID21_001187 [Pseudorhizobium tarimense]|uniref:Uncharacterized protein n=1 Tax=Pseudorhizobium tarimense TaxID=1079109 RepID=A0ABV2H3G8_9HYPH
MVGPEALRNPREISNSTRVGRIADLVDINGLAKLLSHFFSERFRSFCCGRIPLWEAHMSGARPFRDVKLQCFSS